ncbi:MAG: patatin family protein [Atopobiaceae bacterium]|nr:patatin family protein [Atopobiaceae bacterium]
MSENALVLEGGGFRGMFTAGVLDVFMEQGIWDFSSVWGVSAGAIAATSYKSHQIGRSMRIMLAFRDDRRFMSLWSFARTGDIAGSDFMYNEVQSRLDPVDVPTFEANPLRMYAVATDVVYGAPAYLPCTTLPDDVKKVQASASLPPVSRLVEIDGHHYLDGGTSDSIPFEVALGLEGAPRVEGHEPARKAVAILTKDRAYNKSLSPLTYEYIALRSHRYDGFPLYEGLLQSRPDRYNDQRQRLFELEAQPNGPVLVIAPEKPVEVGVSERSGAKLLDLYLQGRSQAERRLEEIRAFLSDKE